jgi:hypothetical protein
MPTLSISEVRKHYWQLAALVKGSLLCPRKCCLNCTIPAEVKRRVLSPEGIRESEGTAVQPFFLKKFKNSALIFADCLKSVDILNLKSRRKYIEFLREKSAAFIKIFLL